MKVIQGDITTIEVDAIVNAANSSLLGGGGVDGAIHRKGGKKILQQCYAIRERQGGCETGKAVYTTAGDLPAQYVIHTVGPVWSGGHRNEAELLRHCYLNSLSLARKLGVKSVTFPNISTGVYRFPKEKAAEIAVKTVKDFLEKEKSKIDVTFVCFEDDNFELYTKLLSS